MPDFRNSSTLLADRSEEVRSSSLIKKKKKQKEKEKHRLHDVSVPFCLLPRITECHIMHDLSPLSSDQGNFPSVQNVS